MAHKRYSIERYIPCRYAIFRRIPNTLIDDEIIMPNAFRLKIEQNEKGISVNWSKYRDVVETKNQEGRKQPHDVRVGEISVSTVRIYKQTSKITCEELPSRSIEPILDIIHHPEPNDDSPERDNQSHSLIVGMENMSRSERNLSRQFLSYKAKLVD